MKGIWKRILCIAIALCMLLQPVAYVQAEGTVSNETNNSSTVQLPLQVNPLYEGLIDEEDFVPDQENQVAAFAEEEITYETDEAKMADQIRQTMIARDNLIELHFTSKDKNDANKFYTWFENAMVETDDPHAGDYLRWNWVTVGGEGSKIRTTSENGIYYFDFIILITYYTTYDQEEELDEKLNRVLKELEVLDSSKSDYEKTKAIYDYICSNVTYDQDSSDNLKYTAYAALINGTSVCQGYSALLYRMLEKAEVDTRMVTGKGNGGDHGWNISELNGKYYYSDSTWDATYKQAGYEYGYFLKGTTDFDEVDPSIEPHVPAENSFVYNEPYAAKLSETAYVPGEDSGDTDGDNGNEDTGNEDTGNEDTIAPVLKSISRVAEDKDAPIYTDSFLEYELAFGDEGGSGIFGVSLCFENPETSEVVAFADECPESGYTDGTMTLKSVKDTRSAGTYRLVSAYIDDYSENASAYTFKYDDEGNITAYKGGEVVEGLDVSDYEFTVSEGSEVVINYKNVLLKEVSLDKQTITSEGKVIANVTVYNPTETAIVFDPENWAVEWSWQVVGEENSYRSNTNYGTGEKVELEAGAETTFQIEYELGKFDSSGLRTMQSMFYMDEDYNTVITYYISDEGLVGRNSEDKEIHRLEYSGEADFEYNNENADDIAPVINNITFSADIGEDGIIYNNTNISLDVSFTEEGPSGISYFSAQYRNEDYDYEEFYFRADEEELTGDNISKVIRNSSRETGDYKLQRVSVEDNAGNVTNYSISYLEDGTSMVSIDGADEIKLSELWPDMQTEYTVVTLPYEGVKITRVEVSTDKQELSGGDEIQVTVTLKNDTDQDMVVYHDNLEIRWWEENKGLHWHYFPTGQTVIEAGKTAEISSVYTVGKYVDSGTRTLYCVEYYSDNRIEYTYDTESGTMVGKDQYYNIVDSWEYDGNADFEVQNDKNVDNEIPEVKAFRVVQAANSEEGKDAIVSLEITDEGPAPLTYVWLGFRDINVKNNMQYYSVNLDSSMKTSDTTYTFPLEVYDDMIAGEYELIYCDISDDADRYSKYSKNAEGVWIKYTEESEWKVEIEAENLVIEKSACNDYDFEDPVFKEISIDLEKVTAGGILSGELTVEDESGLSEMNLSFYDSESEQYLEIEEIELKETDGIYEFEAKLSKYVLPGNYKLQEVSYRDNSIRKNDGYFEFETEEDKKSVTVEPADGIITIDGSAESLETAVEQANTNDIIAIVNNQMDYFILPDSFLQATSKKGIEVVIPSGSDQGEMIIDPEHTATEYPDNILAAYWAYTRVGDPELCEKLDVERFASVEGIMSDSNLPVTLKIKMEEQKNVEYSLFSGNYYTGYKKIADNLEYKDGFVEIDFPQGIGESTFASSLDDVQSFYYYIGIKTKDECTEHESDETYTIVQESTCTVAGYKCYHCVNCGAEIEGSQVPLSLAEHTWDDGKVTTAPTCKDKGVRTYACTVIGCNATKTEEVEATGNHSFTEYKSNGNATCEADGTETAKCNTCEATDTRVIEGSALGHNWDTGKVTTAPTCKDKGIKTYTCTVTGCGKTKTEEVEATGNHSFTEYKSNGNATCEADGTETAKCNTCEATDTRVIEGSALGHNWDTGKVTTPSTCSTKGVKTYTCIVTGCGETKEEVVEVNPENHSWETEYTIDKVSSCTEAGSASKHCSECDIINEASVKAIEKIPHKHSGVYTFVRMADCENGAVLKLFCDYQCGYEFENSRIETHPLGHIHDKKVVTKATTKANGKIEYACSRSGCKHIDGEKTVPIYRPYKMTLSTTTYTYDGKVKSPSVTVVDSKGKKLTKNVDYTVSYASGRKNVGKYTVKVTFKGNYSGTMSASFVINPKGTSISSLAKASKAFTAKWKKQSTQVTGYQIQYSTSKKFSSAKTVTVSSYKTTSKKITKLSAKKTYYVRVRTYKTVGKTKFYSGWSSAKSVKTK